MTEAIGSLKNIHRGQTAWIVGKGPSLVHLRERHFGAGPIITLNQALAVVQELTLVNSLYSLQKDGCGAHAEEERCQPYCYARGPMVVPADRVTMILQADQSEFCMWQHPRRVIVDIMDSFRLSHTAMSILVAVKVARRMGCQRIAFVCCDSMAGDGRTYDPKTGETFEGHAGNYEAANAWIEKELAGFPTDIVIPREE
jgi:hypothetical protein